MLKILPSYWQFGNSLVCIEGELAGRGSVAADVGLVRGDMGNVTCDMLQVTLDT